MFGSSFLALQILLSCISGATIYHQVLKTDMATRPQKGCLLISADGQEVVTWSLHFHNAQRPVWLCGCEFSWSLHFHGAQRPVWLCGCELSRSLHFHGAQRPVWLCGCELSQSQALDGPDIVETAVPFRHHWLRLPQFAIKMINC